MPIMAPMIKTTLRRAMDAVAPAALLICVVSAVRREISSPVFAVSKKLADNLVIWVKTSRRRSATTLSPSQMTK